MVRQAFSISELESIVGREGMQPEPAAFAVDGFVPEAAVAPSSYEQVAEVIRYAAAQGLAVIPWGGGRHMHLGNVPRRYDLALSLSRLTGIVEYEPADLTVTCRAGTSIGELSARLAGEGQIAPLESLWGSEATIGGLLAANAAGPGRHAYGTARDFTIGMKVVTADGRLTKAGGRVVKNVAGYDLCKLYIGSLGTLGVIVEATFKLSPLPKVTRPLVLRFETPSDACAFANGLRGRGLALRSLQVVSGGSATLSLDVAGTPAAVERSLREVDALAKEAGTIVEPAHEPLVFAEAFGAASPSLLCKLSVLPRDVARLFEALNASNDPPRTVVWPTVGVVYAGWPVADDAAGKIERTRALVAAYAGTPVVERCPLELKQTIDVFADIPPSFALMQGVKREFDPQGVLSPGRQVGRQ